MEPKVNEFWVSKEGRTCLLVMDCASGIFNGSGQLLMLWWDESDKEWCVSKLYRRLERKANYTEIQEFLRQLQPE